MHIAGVWVPVMGSNGAAPKSSGAHLMNIVEDERTPTVVGATFAGDGSRAILHAATIAIVRKGTLDDLWHVTPEFPAMSDFWLRYLRLADCRGLTSQSRAQTFFRRHTG